MEKFVNDERGFRKWIDEHPEGYVLNVFSPGCIHRAKCWTLRVLRRDYKGFTGLNSKICSTDRDEIYGLRCVPGVRPRECGHCLKNLK